jgi:hypothetical protein
MRKCFIALFLSSILFSNPSYSDDLYLFSSIGYSDYQINLKDKTEINNKLTSIGFGSAATSIETDNLAYRVGFGLKIPFFFTLEGSYINFGNLNFKTTTTSPSESLSANVALKGLSLDVLQSLGPIAASAGLMMVEDDIAIVSSKGNINVPIDKLLIPKIGVNLKYSDYRVEFNRIFITPNSKIDSLMIGYVFDIF